MINCYDFESVFGNEQCPDLDVDEVICNEAGCGCVYLPFHKVVKHIDEISSFIRERNKGGAIEAIVKEKIKHLSRLFDKETYQDFGYYSKAHFTTKQVFSSEGFSFLEIGAALPETLQVCFDGKLIKPEFYEYIHGTLKINVCKDHGIISCPNHCNNDKIGWLKGCYTITGKFGFRYSDPVIEGAVLEQMMNDFRLIDPKKAVESQLYPQRPTFTKLWNETVGLYRADQTFSMC